MQPVYRPPMAALLLPLANPMRPRPAFRDAGWPVRPVVWALLGLMLAPGLVAHGHAREGAITTPGTPKVFQRQALVHAADTTSCDCYALAAWSNSAGLPAYTVQAITQDREGYLWLGTEGGLVRFNGLQFEPWDASLRWKEAEAWSKAGQNERAARAFVQALLLDPEIARRAR